MALFTVLQRSWFIIYMYKYIASIGARPEAFDELSDI